MLLGRLAEDYFHSEPCKAAFKRVLSVAQKRSQILSFTELTEDPALDEEFRDILRESDKRMCKSVKKAEVLIENLNKYRKTRIMYYNAKRTLEELKGNQVDVDKLLDDNANAITLARSNEHAQEIIHTVGKDGNAVDLAEEALSVEDEVLLKTGFREVDEKNGGLPAEGVLILAATTSGGKSTVLHNLLMNMYKINKISVANVSLEMNARKNSRRMMSRMTQIPYWKFVKKALSKEERAQAIKAWKKFHRFGEKYGCQYSIFAPTHGVNITQLLNLMRPYGHKVLGIDYVSLLDGVDEKDQWKALSAIVRQCKIYSTENHCLVILLAQLDSEDDRIRYSKGMLEHADACWTWNYYKPEVRETKVLPIRQLKARDAELYPFELREMFETMTVDNMDGDDSGSSSSEDGEKKPKKAKGGDDDLNLNEEVSVDYDAGQK